MHRIFFFLPLIAAMLATPVAAQSTGLQLARDTVELLALQKDMLVTAVRQKDSRGGTEDFKRFIMKPLDDMQSKWLTLPRDKRVDYITCIAALQELNNHAADSFKAGKIGKPSSLFAESLANCKKR